jgi:signal transduction histidine kinase
VALLALAFLAWRGDQAAAGKRDADSTVGAPYDLVYTAWVVGLLLLVTFFGISLMALTRLGYLESMAITLIFISSLLLMFSWLSARFDHGDGEGGGGAGVLPALLSRYLLSFGLPYEVWLDKLTALHREEADPADFFNGAMRALGTLAIVAGAEWRGAGMEGQFGATEGGDAVRIAIQEHGKEASREIEVLLRTREVLSPAFLWHFRLLIGLAAEFHWAKAREARLVQQNYLRAVHETGARLTHDVKNLLQSLNGLIEAVNYVEGDDEVRKLIGRQLPAIAQRLGATIAKLQAPSTDSQRMLRLHSWWVSMRKRHERDGLQFQATGIETNLPIAESLFDSAADNLISNALRKRLAQKDLQISVSLTCRGSSIELAVEDDGVEIEPSVAARLFIAPIASRDGLGIGLYQLASSAIELGYRLFIAENRFGGVRIVLTNAPL